MFVLGKSYHLVRLFEMLRPEYLYLSAAVILNQLSTKDLLVIVIG